MSGGVDSSVSAYLLKQQGYEVLGVFMQNWEDDDNDSYCSIKEDSMDAIAVSDKLGIDIEIINFASEYKERVFSYFLEEYQSGRTPNPDILCNSEIKFKAFLDYALNNNADFIATGHYVARDRYNNLDILSKATDINKDQSYFLYRLNQYQVSHALFPLSNLTKPQVRQIASDIGLVNAQKKDSTGICFIGERPFREFLKRYMPTSSGQMITPDGKVVGEHIGLMYYTLGQRKGLGIGGMGEPWFVAGKDLKSNQLIVVQGHDHPLLYSKVVKVNQLSFITGNIPCNGNYTAKTRYRMQDANCQLIQSAEDELTIIFDLPQWAVTPGQSVVIYDGKFCLGGGIIA
jgi:tRNA-uridine 2-sulfurtransferase